MTQAEIKKLKKVLNYGERLVDTVKKANSFIRSWKAERRLKLPPDVYYRVTVTRVKLGPYGPRSLAKSMQFTVGPEEVREHLLPVAKLARDGAKEALKQLKG